LNNHYQKIQKIFFFSVEETLVKTTDGSANDPNKIGYNFGFILLSGNNITANLNHKKPLDGVMMKQPKRVAMLIYEIQNKYYNFVIY